MAAINGRKRPPASTPEARENQMIALAYDLAEKQLLDGTASAQVITNFLKAGSQRDRLEREKITRENLLLKAKADAMDSQVEMKEMYSKALNAMREYSGQDPMDEI
jgi:hypothetical protein